MRSAVIRFYVCLIILLQIVSLINAAVIRQPEDVNSRMLNRLRVKRQWGLGGYGGYGGYSGFLPNGYFSVNGIGVSPYGGLELGSINLSTVNG